MVSNPPVAGLINCREIHGSVVLAWPVSLLFDSPLGSRNFIGFTMPLVDMGLFREAHCYYDSQDRIREFGGAFSWRYLLTAAYNLATVTDDIHQHGHCIADFSGRNILIARTAAVAVIDCDSFQIRDSTSGRIFPSVVGTGEYMPPELMGHNLAEERPDRYFGDLFGLAVMVFKLIMGGVHPFQAGGEGVSSFPGIEQKIQNGVFAFASPDQMIYPPSFAPDYRIIPPSLRRLFSQCFVDGIAEPNCRPSASEWKNCLLSEVVAMKHCRVNVNHWYGGHLAACPWCRHGKKDIFPAEIPLPPRRVPVEVETLPSEGEDMQSFVSTDSLSFSPSPSVPENGCDPVKSDGQEHDVAFVDTSSIAPAMDPSVPDELSEEIPSLSPVMDPSVPDELSEEIPSHSPAMDPSVPVELSAEDPLFSPSMDTSVPDELSDETPSLSPVMDPSVPDELSEVIPTAPAILIPEPHMSMHDVARGITIPCRLPVTVTGDSPLLIHLTTDVPWIEIPDVAVPVEGEGGVNVVLNTGNMSNKGFQNGRVILNAGDIRTEIYLFISVLPEF
ncbi:hypothetical protein L0665_03295 [Methanogenium marinum]|uniref:Protein kinase domain-containing protein n=1 Tax=Methanogenium marinum TaxID=348610 RepID=A0A9Q4KSC2_9EURY|nr:hypothetical protein [Methanogenium marinum]MDE4907636.1 hypothetical protein [Methanogenium marinum]